MTDDKPAASTNKLGRFVVKDDSDEADSIRVGSLFARRKDIEAQPLKGEVFWYAVYDTLFNQL
jgi:hypothetical protein